MKQAERCKLITAIVPNDGTDRELLRALRTDKQVIRASSMSVRGMAILESVLSRPGVASGDMMVKLVNVIVEEASAEQLFDYVYEKANIGRPGGGVVCMDGDITATPYSLPEGVPDEK